MPFLRFAATLMLIFLRHIAFHAAMDIAADIFALIADYAVFAAFAAFSADGCR